MKFSHIADAHIGSWRDELMRDISTKAFIKAINISIEEKVDFILFSGDLFNTPLPGVDNLKLVVKKLVVLKNAKIPFYIIPGSHDYSPSGKTMIDVLEEAGLMKNVFRGEISDGKLKLKFTIDEKTNAKITGIIGRKGMLDKKYYENLDLNALEKEEGFKIFMFHTSITELKPKELEKMDSTPVSFLPKNMDYYAGGHVHIIEKFTDTNYKNVVYPGPLFPNNFLELEKLHHGGFYIYEDEIIERKEIELYNYKGLKLDCNEKTPEEITNEILEWTDKNNFENSIVTLRLYGIISAGKIIDIDFKKIFERLKEKKAYFIMRNTLKLSSEKIEEIKTHEQTTEEIEESTIKEHSGKIKVDFDEVEMAKKLLNVLSSERGEGEKVYEYQDRIKEQARDLMKLK